MTRAVAALLAGAALLAASNTAASAEPGVRHALIICGLAGDAAHCVLFASTVEQLYLGLAFVARGIALAGDRVVADAGDCCRVASLAKAGVPLVSAWIGPPTPELLVDLLSVSLPFLLLDARNLVHDEPPRRWSARCPTLQTWTLWGVAIGFRRSICRLRVELFAIAACCLARDSFGHGNRARVGYRFDIHDLAVVLGFGPRLVEPRRLGRNARCMAAWTSATRARDQRGAVDPPLVGIFSSRCCRW